MREIQADLEAAFEQFKGIVEELGDISGKTLRHLWLPDIHSWARIIVGCLKPGGTFYLRDSHPFRRLVFPIVLDAHGQPADNQYFSCVHSTQRRGAPDGLFSGTRDRENFVRAVRHGAAHRIPA